MSETREPGERRRFLASASSVAMAGGVLAAYGTLAAFMSRFLYPAKSADRGWMFVTEIAALRVGDALNYRTPGGGSVVITRQGPGATVEAFLALSSTCPHLGCRVHWEAQNNRFFCPCHNGVFDAQGKATGGPPGDAGQELPKYPLKVENGLLFIEVPTAELSLGPGEILAPEQTGPGHDPVLYARKTPTPPPSPTEEG